MTNPSAVLATFEDVKRVKTRKVWQLIFEVPEERADQALQALGGSPQSGQDRWVGIARVDEKVAVVPQDARSAPEGTETPATPETRTQPPKERRPWHELSATTQAGIRCNERDFLKWLLPSMWMRPDAPKIAVMTIRDRCGVKSRAELDQNEQAARMWHAIERDYQASQRGQSDEELAKQARR